MGRKKKAEVPDTTVKSNMKEYIESGIKAYLSELQEKEAKLGSSNLDAEQKRVYKGQRLTYEATLKAIVNSSKYGDFQKAVETTKNDVMREICNLQVKTAGKRKKVENKEEMDILTGKYIAIIRVWSIIANCF